MRALAPAILNPGSSLVLRAPWKTTPLTHRASKDQDEPSSLQSDAVSRVNGAYPGPILIGWSGIVRGGSRIGVIIPALNEEKSIGRVLSEIPVWADDVVVVDNGSTDGTAQEAAACGALVIAEPRRGYGSACRAGIRALAQKSDILVFLDADFSDSPGEMARLVDPIIECDAELVLGSRVLGNREPGSLTVQARVGNWLACLLIRLLWKRGYTDLGPFRAVRADTLERFEMRDRGYGWTVEMQVKAARERTPVLEVPVSYCRRIGKSKISGTVRGAVGAGIKILATILLAALSTLLTRRSRPASNRSNRRTS